MEEVDQELNDETSRYRRYLIELLDLASYDQLNKPGSYMDIDRNTTNGDPAFIFNDPAKLKIIYNEVFALKACLYNSVRSAEALLKNADKLLPLQHPQDSSDTKQIANLIADLSPANIFQYSSGLLPDYRSFQSLSELMYRC